MGLRCEIVAIGHEFKVVQCKVCHDECEWCWPYCQYDLDDQMLQDERRWNLENGIAAEDELAWAYIHGESDVPWPWYADSPCIVQEPEVFGP